MQNLVVKNNRKEVVITLKEITDMIGVDHSKSMKKIEKLANEPSFGGLAKMATPTFNPDGSKNRLINTYQLTKKQAIAVAARLNNTMLMKVIDRLEELEREKHKIALPDFTNPVIAARAWADAKESEAKAFLEVNKKNKLLKEKDEVILAVADLNIKSGDVTVGDLAKNLALKGLGQNNLFKWLKGRGFLMDNTAPYQPYVERGYFTRKPSKEKINGKYRYTTYVTPKGTTWVAKMIRAEFNLDSE